MITHDAMYTFEFTYRSKQGMIKQHRRVPVGELWERFGQACDWRRSGPAEQVRSASVYGPGVYRTACTEYERDHLRSLLEPLGLVPFEPAYVGLLWANLGHGYVLYKVRRETVEMEDYERPHVATTSLEPVDAEKVEAAFCWASEKCWHVKGVWVADAPGLAWMGDWDTLANALQDCPQVARKLFEGRLITASVRYDWQNPTGSYPYMRPTRLRARIQDLRARFPSAVEDLAVAPTCVLHRRYGDGLPTGISPTPAFAG